MPNSTLFLQDGFTALTWAAKDDHEEILTKLLEAGAYVNPPDRLGDTILIHAVKGGHLDVVRALLKKCADVDVEGIVSRVYSAMSSHFIQGTVPTLLTLALQVWLISLI